MLHWCSGAAWPALYRCIHWSLGAGWRFPQGKGISNNTPPCPMGLLESAHANSRCKSEWPCVMLAGPGRRLGYSWGLPFWSCPLPGWATPLFHLKILSPPSKPLTPCCCCWNGRGVQQESGLEVGRECICWAVQAYLLHQADSLAVSSAGQHLPTIVPNSCSKLCL